MPWRRQVSLTVAAMALVALASACASGPRRPAGPVVSPTGIVYEPGTPPARTRYSQTAVLYIVQGNARRVGDEAADLYERAVGIAQEGITADPTNPIHYYLAGLAQSRLRRYEDADKNFTEAQRIYPAYQLEIEPERLAAWSEAYNAGVQAFDSGSEEGAVKAWTDAARMYDLRTEAHRNLASMLTREGVYEEAIDTYRRALAGLDKKPATVVLSDEEMKARAEERYATEESLAQVLLFVKRYAEAEPLLRDQLSRDTTSVPIKSDLATAIAGQNRLDEAAQIYAGLLEQQNLTSAQLFNLGIALFRTKDFERAGKAFARLTELRPDSRDAWFNLANTMFAGSDWGGLAQAGDRLTQLDPLGKNVGLLAARAHLETGDPMGALSRMKRVDGAPVYVEDLQMRPLGTATRVVGRLVGNTAAAGTPVRLRFSFYDEADPLGSETLDVPAPAPGESKQLEILFQTGATAFRYELVP